MSKTDQVVFDAPEPLGTITTEEMLVYYDGPYLFFATNASKRFLGMLCDRQTYALAEISVEKYEALKLGEDDIRSAFVGECWRVEWNGKDWALTFGHLPEDEMPDTGGFLPI